MFNSTPKSEQPLELTSKQQDKINRILNSKMDDKAKFHMLASLQQQIYTKQMVTESKGFTSSSKTPFVASDNDSTILAQSSDFPGVSQSAMKVKPKTLQPLKGIHSSNTSEVRASSIVRIDEDSHNEELLRNLKPKKVKTQHPMTVTNRVNRKIINEAGRYLVSTQMKAAG